MERDKILEAIGEFERAVEEGSIDRIKGGISFVTARKWLEENGVDVRVDSFMDLIGYEKALQPKKDGGTFTVYYKRL